MSGFTYRVMRKLGLALRPLLDPDAQEHRKKELEFAKQLRDVQASDTRLEKQLGKVMRRVDEMDRLHVKDLARAMADLRHDARQQNAFARRLLRAARHDSHRESLREAALKRLRYLSRQQGPVLVGPWTGEVGFELLYWAPFVRWAVREANIAPERITILSRGGTQSWYGLEGASYRDVFDFTTPEVLR